MKNKTISRMIKLIKPKKKPLIIISIISILITICELIKPYIIKIVIDDYLSLGIYEKGFVTIGMLGAIYIGIVLIGNILDFITTTATTMVGEDVIYSLRNKLFRYIENANVPFHDKTPAGTLFVRVTNDVEDITTLFEEIATTIIKDILLIIILIAMMIYISAKLSLICLILIPLIVISSLLITKAINKLYEYSKAIRTKLNVFLAESIYGMKLIKIFGRQYEKQKECEGLTEKFRKSRIKPTLLEGLLPGLMTIFENLGVALISWACVNHWLGINLNIGVIYVFITYTKQIFEPINRIIENVETLQESLVSIDKIFEILEQKQYLEDFENGITLEDVKGKIEFKNVWFAYKDENWVLKDVSFTIQPGESIALVGKTGSGKTTITNLINRFYEIQKGEILLDGINIKDINLRSLRKNIGTILQDPFIFAKTIRDNITLSENLSDEQILEAIQLSSAEEFVNSLPEGIDEISHERGSSYSAGQKQLLAFARIFAHNPSIFILDEATANIDTYTENLIQKSIDKISKEKTSIFIAHRLSTIVNVDKIIVLQNGSIIEQGNHQELLQIGGYYSSLYNSYYETLTES